jgi:hypothetical protein
LQFSAFSNFEIHELHMNTIFASITRLAASAWCGYARLNGMHSSRLGQEPKALDYLAQPGEGHV